jgi:hypothetical protein
MPRLASDCAIQRHRRECFDRATDHRAFRLSMSDFWSIALWSKPRKQSLKQMLGFWVRRSPILTR